MTRRHARQFHSFLWACASILLVSSAQLSLKFGMLHFSSPMTLEGVKSTLQIGQWHWVLLPIAFGLGAYLISVLCWMSALKHLPLSFAYPLLSISYILVYVGAMCLPGIDENFSLMRLFGVVLVMLGLVLVAIPGGKKLKSVN